MRYAVTVERDSLEESIVHCLRESPLTRNAMCDKLGVSRTTLSRALSELMDRGTVRAEVHSSGGRGRPVQTFHLSNDVVHAVGIDISRTHASALAVNRLEQQLCTARFRYYSDSSWESVLKKLCTELDHRMKEAGVETTSIHHVGVGMPMPIGIAVQDDGERLIPDYAKLQTYVEELWGAPTLIDNTIRMAALVEARAGAGRGFDSQFYLRISNGMMGCTVVSNRVVPGSQGYAGEVGHLAFPGGAEHCICGRNGCLETVATMPAIIRHAQARDLEELLTKLSNNDPLAAAAVDQAAQAVAQACSQAVLFFNPARLILSGDVPAEIPEFVAKVNALLQEQLIPGLYNGVACVSAELDGAQSVRGALFAGEAYAAMLESRHKKTRR